MKDKRSAIMASKALFSFTDIQTDTFYAWLAQPVPTPMASLHKVRLWRAAPLFLRQGVYDELRPLFEAECTDWGFDIAEAFPEPPGMADYRHLHPDRRRPERPDEVETLPMKIGD